MYSSSTKYAKIRWNLHPDSLILNSILDTNHRRYVHTVSLSFLYVEIVILYDRVYFALVYVVFLNELWPVKFAHVAMQTDEL